MKKIIAISSALTMISMLVAPAMALATVDPGSVSTGLTRDTSGGATPIVKAKWEMNGPSWSGSTFIGTGTDDSIAAGAQFMPSGQYQVNKNITICAVVSDADGVAGIDGVYSDVFYPDNIDLGSSHVAIDNQSGKGCGKLMEEDTLTKLSKADGITLFCNNIKNNNNNLPKFSDSYTYEEICKADGELQKETAAVYCGDKRLSYEDPAGSYPVAVAAQSTTGQTGSLKNAFTYLPVTAFETDFRVVNYGNVRLNIHKIISGDLTWDAPPVDAKPATVRNTGNTRLNMWVKQDDMGLGMTSGLYNVKYDARVGNNESDWTVYDPNANTMLKKSMDLSEMNEMDFSIDISKFPPTHPDPSFTGQMCLSATQADQLICSPK